MKSHTHLYNPICSFENLYLASKKAEKGKRALRRLYHTGRILREKVNAAVQAWLGHVRHGDTWGLRRALFRQYTFSKAKTEK